jgi:hypothetical protein
VEVILQFVGRLLATVVLLQTGKAVVFLVSLGRWRVESIDGEEGRVHGPAGAISFKRGGQRVITTKGGSLIGLVFCLVLIALIVTA